MIHRSLVVALLVTVAAAAEPDAAQPVDVPDPIGLGERLALIDWLREHGQPPADGASLEALRLAYLHAAHPDRFATPAAGDEAEARDRDALAVELWRRHGKNPPPGATAADLRALLAALDHADDERAASEAARAREGAAPTAGSGTHASSAIPATPGSPPAGDGDGPKPAPRPAAAVPMAKRQVDLSIVPPVDEAHADAWSNYASPISAVKGAVEFRLYLRVGDDRHVYLWYNNRNSSPRSAQVTVGGRQQTVFVTMGHSIAPTAIALDPGTQPSLDIGEVQ